MNSLFIAGTDTDVGKTIITAGLARWLSNNKINVGVMKPFAAGEQQKSGFLSSDSEILAKAARVSDPESLINPQFYPIPASPFTAKQNLDVDVDIKLVLESFEELKQIHDVLLVEGMGGIMTPIESNYFVTDLIKDMGLETIIITRSKIGTINHTLMTNKLAEMSELKVKGIVINNFDAEGYVVSELKRDLELLINVPVLGSIPKLNNLDVEYVAKVLDENIDLKSLFKL